MRNLRTFLRDQRGGEGWEYALILGVVVIGTLVLAGGVAQKVNAKLNELDAANTTTAKQSQYKVAQKKTSTTQKTSGPSQSAAPANAKPKTAR